jgi:soluble lytic murein transglycosylase-like protein
MIQLILAIALEIGVPGNFMVALAEVENPQMNPKAVNVNRDGTKDLGLMQLNSSWYTDAGWADPETNIRAACVHVKWLKNNYNFNWWQVAVAYNAGHNAVLKERVPNKSIEYANKVIAQFGYNSGWR